jgi:hypothetical protein
MAKPCAAGRSVLDVAVLDVAVLGVSVFMSYLISPLDRNWKSGLGAALQPTYPSAARQKL